MRLFSDLRVPRHEYKEQQPLAKGPGLRAPVEVVVSIPIVDNEVEATTGHLVGQADLVHRPGPALCLLAARNLNAAPATRSVDQLHKKILLATGLRSFF